MDLIHLRYFIAAVDENSVTRAAEKLHITQPALSKALAKLEKELGVRLFARAGRGNSLTPEGQAFYKWADKTLRGYRAVIREINAADANSLNIAISSINSTNSLINAFCLEYPCIRCNEQTFSREDFPAIIFNQEVDCVLSTLEYRAENVNCLLISHSPLYIACCPGHPLAARKEISLLDAKEERFIFPLRRSLFYTALGTIFERAGFTPEVVAEAETTHTYDMVKRGIGITICSGTSIYKNQTVCPIIRLTDDFCHRDTFLLWQKQEHISSALSSFIDYSAEFAHAQPLT